MPSQMTATAVLQRLFGLVEHDILLVLPGLSLAFTFASTDLRMQSFLGQRRRSQVRISLGGSLDFSRENRF